MLLLSDNKSMYQDLEIPLEGFLTFLSVYQGEEHTPGMYQPSASYSTLYFYCGALLIFQVTNKDLLALLVHFSALKIWKKITKINLCSTFRQLGLL